MRDYKRLRVLEFSSETRKPNSLHYCSFMHWQILYSCHDRKAHALLTINSNSLIHIPQQRWMEIDRGSQKSWSIIIWWTKDITTWCGDHSPTIHSIIYKYLYKRWDLNLSKHHQTWGGGTMCCKARFGRKKEKWACINPSLLFVSKPLVHHSSNVCQKKTQHQHVMEMLNVQYQM